MNYRHGWDVKVEIPAETGAVRMSLTIVVDRQLRSRPAMRARFVPLPPSQLTRRAFLVRPLRGWRL